MDQLFFHPAMLILGSRITAGGTRMGLKCPFIGEQVLYPLCYLSGLRTVLQREDSAKESDLRQRGLLEVIGVVTDAEAS